MKDIAERLLEHDGTVTSNRLAEEAAAEIERLRYAARQACRWVELHRTQGLSADATLREIERDLKRGLSAHVPGSLK